MTNPTPEQGTKQPPVLLKPRDVAERLSISMDTLDRIIARGDLEVVRVGGQRRLRKADVEALWGVEL